MTACESTWKSSARVQKRDVSDRFGRDVSKQRERRTKAGCASRQVNKVLCARAAYRTSYAITMREFESETSQWGASAMQPWLARASTARRHKLRRGTKAQRAGCVPLKRSHAMICENQQCAYASATRVRISVCVHMVRGHIWHIRAHQVRRG
eukprot:5279155-Pleurochrysis_carterae.AAC.3